MEILKVHDEEDVKMKKGNEEHEVEVKKEESKG